MSFKRNLAEMRDWFGYRRREVNIRAKLVKKHLKTDNERKEYFNFVRVVTEQIDKMLYSGENSKMVIKPLPGKEHLFKMLIEEEDFTRFYNGRITAGGELEVSIKKIG